MSMAPDNGPDTERAPAPWGVYCLELQRYDTTWGTGLTEADARTAAAKAQAGTILGYHYVARDMSRAVPPVPRPPAKATLRATGSMRDALEDMMRRAGIDPDNPSNWDMSFAEFALAADSRGTR